MRTATANLCLVATVAVALLAIAAVPTIRAAAVMSIDLGSEWLKVGVVSPGVPMEIALNKESKRKTPAVIAFRDGNRIFGEDAQTIGLRFPDRSYAYLTDLLGKRADNPLVDLYRHRFPYHTLEADPQRHTVVFRSKSDDQTFTVEELVAQFIQKAREAAEATAGQAVTECVLVVPGFFGQSERNALLASAELAKIKVLQLINDYTAVALNYGIFARKDFNETAQYYMFYDMGASKTSAVVVSYQLQKDKQTRETLPVIQVLGVGWDRTLGGLEMQLRLRDHLAKQFNALGKTKTDVRTNGRAMAKLFKEAGRVKNVLSANVNHFAQIEGLIDEQDFKQMVTREEFEALCGDLFERVAGPVEQALRAAQLTMDNIKQVILFGGGTRVPRVQEHLRAAIAPLELSKNINMDEAAAMGAVYRAADLATGFRVQKFVTKDAAVFPVQVQFEREAEAGQVKQVRRSLFGHMNAYPQKKVITFNKHVVDFGFEVQYAELETLLSEEERKAVGGVQLARVELKDVAEALAKQGVRAAAEEAGDEEAAGAQKIESKGIKAHFVLDESGVFSMSSVELVVEKTVAGADAGDESPLSKLGSTISKLFSSEKEAEGETVQTDESAAQNATETAEGKPATNETTETGTANATAEAGDEAAQKNATETVKIVTVKQPITSTIQLLTAEALSGEQLEKVSAKIEEISEREARTVRKDAALNALESYVIDTNQRLDETEYTECATAEEVDRIRAAGAEISDWLYEDGENADAETYEKRLDELKELTKPVLARHWEHGERAETVERLEGMLKTAREFHVNGKNFTKEVNADRDVFTPVELDTLEKKIAETEKWLAEEVAAQAKLAKSDDVRLTVRSLNERMASLDREIKYLVNKLKIWKPKVKPAEKKEKKDKKKKEKKEKKDGEEVADEKPVVEEVIEEAPEAETPTIDATATEEAKTEQKHSEL